MTSHTPAALPHALPRLPAQAMLLAAGRGQRMMPLTATCPKPMLAVRGQALLHWPMQALARGGFVRQVVNTAWLGEQVEAGTRLGAGAAVAGVGAVAGMGADAAGVAQAQSLAWPDVPPVQVAFSHEGRDFGHALETAGAVLRVLPQMDAVFWVVAGDVFAPGFAFNGADVARFAASSARAHLWLVANPEHNPGGDFGLSADGLALNLPAGHAGRRYTFSTIALYKHVFFADCGVPAGNPQGVALALAPLLRTAMDAGWVTAQVYAGEWADVGTPERLAQINAG